MRLLWEDDPRGVSSEETSVGNKDLEKRASERARAQLPYLGIFAYAGFSCLQLLKSHVTSEGSKSLRLRERERGRCVKRLMVRKEEGR